MGLQAASSQPFSKLNESLFVQSFCVFFFHSIKLVAALVYHAAVNMKIFTFPTPHPSATTRHLFFSNNPPFFPYSTVHFGARFYPVGHRQLRATSAGIAVLVSGRSFSNGASYESTVHLGFSSSGQLTPG